MDILKGTLSAPKSLKGSLTAQQTLKGSLSVIKEISGRLSEKFYYKTPYYEVDNLTGTTIYIGDDYNGN